MVFKPFSRSPQGRKEPSDRRTIYKDPLEVDRPQQERLPYENLSIPLDPPLPPPPGPLPTAPTLVDNYEGYSIYDSYSRNTEKVANNNVEIQLEDMDARGEEGSIRESIEAEIAIGSGLLRGADLAMYDSQGGNSSRPSSGMTIYAVDDNWIEPPREHRARSLSQPYILPPLLYSGGDSSLNYLANDGHDDNRNRNLGSPGGSELGRAARKGENLRKSVLRSATRNEFQQLPSQLRYVSKAGPPRPPKLDLESSNNYINADGRVRHNRTPSIQTAETEQLLLDDGSQQPPRPERTFPADVMRRKSSRGAISSVASFVPTIVSSDHNQQSVYFDISQGSFENRDLSLDDDTTAYGGSLVKRSRFSKFSEADGSSISSDASEEGLLSRRLSQLSTEENVPAKKGILTRYQCGFGSVRCSIFVWLAILLTLLTGGALALYFFVFLPDCACVEDTVNGGCLFLGKVVKDTLLDASNMNLRINATETSRLFDLWGLGCKDQSSLIKLDVAGSNNNAILSKRQKFARASILRAATATEDLQGATDLKDALASMPLATVSSSVVALQVLSRGVRYDLSGLRVTFPENTWLKNSNVTAAQQPRMPGNLIPTLNELTSVAVGMSLQKTRALQMFFTDVLGFSIADLDVFRQRFRSSPVQTVFDCASKFDNRFQITTLNQFTNRSKIANTSVITNFPPRWCTVNTSVEDRGVLNQVEAALFKLPQITDKAAGIAGCNNRPTYGTLNLFFLRTGSNDPQDGQQAVTMSEDLKARMTIVGRRTLHGSLLPVNLASSPSDIDISKVGTLANMDHVILDYLRDVAKDIDLARKIVEYVNEGKGSFKSSGQLPGFAVPPMPEIHVWGGIAVTPNSGEILHLNTGFFRLFPQDRKFMGGAVAFEFRQWAFQLGVPIIWSFDAFTQTTITNPLGPDGRTPAPEFDAIFQASAPGGANLVNIFSSLQALKS